MNRHKPALAGFAPVVIDLETGGVDCNTDALLEIAAIHLVSLDGVWQLGESFHRHIVAHPDLRCDPAALAITGIVPEQPLRAAVGEPLMLADLAHFIAMCCQYSGTDRAILVGHNAHFDLGFLNAALARCQQTLQLHRFSCVDTATLGMVLEGENVLARLLPKAQMRYQKHKAHSALYDATITAKLCAHWLNQIDASSSA